LTLLFDLPVEVGLKRALKRNVDQEKCDSEGRFEAESMAFHERIREGYLTWAALNRDRFRIVDAAAPLDEVTDFTLRRVLAKTGETPHDG
jgi:dTMP kinase